LPLLAAAVRLAPAAMRRDAQHGALAAPPLTPCRRLNSHRHTGVSAVGCTGLGASGATAAAAAVPRQRVDTGVRNHFAFGSESATIPSVRKIGVTSNRGRACGQGAMGGGFQGL